MNNNNSGVNTIILVLILALVLGGIVWFLKGSQQESEGVDIDLNLPQDQSE